MLLLCNVSLVLCYWTSVLEETAWWGFVYRGMCKWLHYDCMRVCLWRNVSETALWEFFCRGMCKRLHYEGFSIEECVLGCVHMRGSVFRWLCVNLCRWEGWLQRNVCWRVCKDGLSLEDCVLACVAHTSTQFQKQTLSSTHFAIHDPLKTSHLLYACQHTILWRQTLSSAHVSRHSQHTLTYNPLKTNLLFGTHINV